MSSFNFTANSNELSTGPGQRGSQDFLTANFDAEYPFINILILVKDGINSLFLFKEYQLYLAGIFEENL